MQKRGALTHVESTIGRKASSIHVSQDQFVSAVLHRTGSTVFAQRLVQETQELGAQTPHPPSPSPCSLHSPCSPWLRWPRHTPACNPAPIVIAKGGLPQMRRLGAQFSAIQDTMPFIQGPPSLYQREQAGLVSRLSFLLRNERLGITSACRS